ncbi:hypothetical protein OO013_17810 [Mangrovivirga sp. M17]|uniref:Outer membrane protein with beta-barrel domain n=1 Tax=Mangrovivirga halotolerans TaxID=2993936 RepID=A0ABT3RVT7_9BACT|nr:hypothetical protein [Mangrovivirga halotolerans]MCX2745743.1 hypothetical protein [Mangrovivirga halotolerans]
MKKLLLTFFAVIALSFASNAQGWGPDKGTTQISAGLGTGVYGIPVFADVQFGVSEYITLGPRVAFSSRTTYYGNDRYRESYFSLSMVANYHYSKHISALPSELDLYGGLELGYVAYRDNWNDDLYTPEDRSTVMLGIRAGAKWFFTPNFGAMLELGGGAGRSGALVGVTFGL